VYIFRPFCLHCGVCSIQWPHHPPDPQELFVRRGPNNLLSGQEPPRPFHQRYSAQRSHHLTVLTYRRYTVGATSGPEPPALHSSLTAWYMPNGTAAVQDEIAASEGVDNGTHERLQTLCQTNVPFSRNKTVYALLVYSPAFTNSRLIYTTMLEEVARNGYIVAAVDHAYDANVVDFGNGDLVEFTEYAGP